MPNTNNLACMLFFSFNTWICCFIGSPLCFDRNARGCICLRPVCCNHQSHHSAGVHLWRFAAVLLRAHSCSDPRAWLSLGWLCRQSALWFDHGLQVCWCSHEDEACRIACQQTDAPTQQWSWETSKWRGQCVFTRAVFSVMEFKLSLFWWNTILPPYVHVLMSRYWGRHWWWSVNAMACLVPAPYGPAGKVYKTCGRLPLTWRPSTCLPPRWSTGPWGHASSWCPKILTSGRWGRTSWSTCRALQTSAPRMINKALWAHKTGETVMSCCCLWVCTRKRRAARIVLFARLVSIFVRHRPMVLTNRKWPVL